MYYRKLVLSIVIFAFILTCCKENITNPVKSPQIIFIAPSSGRIGDTITVIGIYFGSDRANSFLSFNKLKANEYISWSETQIKLKIPADAVSGKLSATINSVKSNEVEFKLIPTVDYESVILDTQIWMKRNLDVDHYRNGDSIPEVRDSIEWANLTTGAWCNFNNDPAMGEIYGKLYNWYAVHDPRGLAPHGWHIASYLEWKRTNQYLGVSKAGGLLKASGLDYWKSPNAGATNETGFSALPGGWRSSETKSGRMEFINLSLNSYFWTSTEETHWSAMFYYLTFDQIHLNYSHQRKETGLSVRCIKD